MNKRYPTFKVPPEVCVAGTILTMRSKSHTIGKHRFQLVEILPTDVQCFVDNDSGEVLPSALVHDTSFPIMNGEILFHGDRGNVNTEASRGPAKPQATRKCEIVGIPRVYRTRRVGQSAQTTIEPVCT